MNKKKPFIFSIIISLLLSLTIFLLSPLLQRFPHLDDQGAFWYYWKLPEATLLGTITAWGGYLLHQIFIFYYIYKMKKRGVSPFTTRFLITNLVFVTLHIVQTHLFYDGIAQQVPVWSSQYSVIGMLSITIILLMPKRGFILGKFRIVNRDVYTFFRKYHGIYISWALVYTFWFHPTEGNFAILLGFFYMFLLFIQMSFAKTKLHGNINWNTLLESFVVVHGVAIALMNGQEIWPMFLTGFLFMFVFTYLYGLKIGRRGRILVTILYIVLTGILYYFRGFDKLYEVSFIPLTLYLLSLVLLGIVKLLYLIKPKKG